VGAAQSGTVAPREVRIACTRLAVTRANSAKNRDLRAVADPRHGRCCTNDRGAMTRLRHAHPLVSTLGALALGAASLAGLVYPSPASACGGFFCSNQPIDQSGENIIFSVEEDGAIEAHVQILYQGAAEQFAWILPTPSAPAISVGTDALFRALDQSTRPVFFTNSETTGTCRSEPSCYDYYDADRGGPAFAGGFADAGAASAPPSGVDVVFRGNVGPYDAAVLTATDVNALYDWLNEYDYQIPESARPEIDAYIATRSYFVALRLQKDRAVGEIQPIVLRYTNGEPCIPIRLTRIAAVDDMPIRAYFLASQGMRSTNYTMLTPDVDDEPGLFLGSRSYESVVTNAVDDAGGRAFVTDYLGSTPSVALELPDIADLATVSDARAFVRALRERGFVGDTQLLALLQRFLPPPTPEDATSFYNCLVQSWCSGYEDYLAGLLFQPADFVAALEEAILAPRRNAQAMVGRHPMLTRLYTTMSAAEMTEDPVFYPSDAARTVSNIHTARLITECSPDYFWFAAPQRLVLPTGREVRAREGVVYPGSDEMYCADRGAGTFSPWTPVDTLRETADLRAREAVSASGSGLCSASPGAGGAGGALAALGAVIAAIVARRRR